MAGISIKPNAPQGMPAPAAPAPVATATPATVAVDPTAFPPASPTTATAIGTNDGQVITMPNVAANPVPPSNRLDDGDDADYEILHTRVGKFAQGDRVKAARFPEGCDFERLLKLEAVKALKDEAPADEATPKKGK